PSGTRYQVSNAGGTEARWRQDGKEIFFISPDLKLMAAQVVNNAPFESGNPKPLFNIQERFLGFERGNYAVSKDGNRFLINTMVDPTNSNAIHLKTNWTPNAAQPE